MVIIKKRKAPEPLDLYDIYDNINYDIFDGELDLPILGCTYLEEIDGIYLFKDGTHYIAIALNLGYMEGIRTLIHEMVHQWQYQNRVKLSHNKQFVSICRKAEKLYGFKKRSIEGTNNSKKSRAIK